MRFKKVILYVMMITTVILMTACGKSKTKEDWYVEGDTLYINKITYTIKDAMGYKYVYDKPWSKEIRNVDKLVVNAKMERNGNDNAEITGNEDIVNTGNLFGGFRGTESNVNIDMNGVKDASFMFSGCDELCKAKIKLEGDVENCAYLFAGDKKLLDADVTLPASVNNVKRMFYECRSLKNPVLLFQGAVIDCSGMFYGCEVLPTVKIPFQIGQETQYLDMFSNCNQLTGVNFTQSVNLGKKGSTFFNGINKITDFSFADTWNVLEETNPIGEMLSDVVIVKLPMEGDFFLSFVFYLKTIPNWYHDFARYVYQLDDFLQIEQSTIMDVYLSSSDSSTPYEEITDKMVMDAVTDAILKLDKSSGAQAAAYVKDKIDKAELIKDFAKALSDV